MPNTIVVYGGTFDPLHNGHLLCVEAAKQTFPHSQVHLYPTYAPLVDDTATRKQPLLTFADRTCLLQRHFATDPQVIISTLEKDMPTPNLTYNLIQALRHQYPHAKLVLLCGQDQYQHFAAWEGAKAMLLSGCNLAIVGRPNSLPIATITTTLAEKLSLTLTPKQDCYLHSRDSLLFKGAQDSLTLTPKQGCYFHHKFSIYCINSPQLAVSSTAVREAIRNQRSPANIPAAVANYLKHR